MRYLSLFVLVIFPALLYSNEIYTTGLYVKVEQTNKVRIEWAANTNKCEFNLYRIKDTPVLSLDVLSNAELVATITGEGSTKGDLYSFPAYYDNVKQDGNYYYAILPKKEKYSPDDLLIGLNLTIRPITITIPQLMDEQQEVKQLEIEKGTELEEKPFIVHTSGLKLNLVPTNQVSIEWKANTNQGFFLIYRSTEPIDTIEKLRNAKLIAEVEAKGSVYADVYRFPIYYDTIDKSGDYYYLVLAKRDYYTQNDLFPGINLNINPIKVNLIEKETQPAIEPVPDIWVTNIMVKHKKGYFIVMWDLNYYPDRELNFLIYRTLFPVYTWNDLNGVFPYRVIDNDYYFEDYDINLEEYYYYTILVDSNTNIYPGNNSMIRPAIYADTFPEVEIETEYIYSTNDIKLQITNQKTEIKFEQKFRTLTNTNNNLQMTKNVLPDKTDQTHVQITQNTNKLKKKANDFNIYVEKQKNKDTYQSKNETLVYSYKIETKTKLKNKIKPLTNQILPEKDKQIALVDVDYFAEGLKHYKNQNFSIAVEYFQKAKDPEAEFYLGKSYFHLGKYELALRSFIKYAQLDHKNADIWIKLTLNRLGDE